jgi:hypothetical protein
MIRDFNIEWLEKKIFIPAQSFADQIAGAPIGDSTQPYTEIGATDVTTVLFTTGTSGFNHHMMIPYDVDINHAIRFRVWWTINVTDADVETPVITYVPFVAGTTVFTDTQTVLDTPIPAYTFGAVANVAEVTDFGAIKRKTLLSTHEYIALKVLLTLNTASTAEVGLLGLEMRYTPRKTGGPRRNIIGGRRLKTANPMGVLLAPAQEGL